MDMYVVGLYKKGKSIVGFRLLALNQDGTTEVKDVSYNDVFNVIKSNRANIKNLKIDNGELKGVNGRLDRYGVLGKTQAIVVLKELVDKHGKNQGYLCSDSLGQTRMLTEQQVVMFADKFGIANGKLVSEDNGNKHVSCIEGTYGSLRVNNQNTNKQPTETSKPSNKSNDTVDKNKSTLSSDVLDIVNKVKSHKKYGGTAEKIVNNIEKAGRCTDKQKEALISIYNTWNGKSQLSDEVKNLVAEVKTYSKFKGSFAENIVKYVEAYKRCSDKQLSSLKKERDRLKKIDDDIKSKQQATQQQATAPVQTQTPVKTPSPVQTQTPVKTAPVQKASMTKKINDITRKNNEEQRKFNEDARREKEEVAKKNLTAKEKRALTQNIASKGLFDFSFTKDGRAYVEGFSENAVVPDDLVIPETVERDGKTYIVTGITMGAFQTEPIVTVTTSKYINDIGQNSFQFCTKLKKVDLSQSVHSLIPARCFKGCENLTEINIGNNVQKVHEYAFSGCKMLESIVLPPTCTTVARAAFEYCYSLRSCRNSVKNLDALAFYNCGALNDFDFSSMISIGPRVFRRAGFNELVLPGNIRVMGEKAFADCYLLQKVTLEEGIDELGDYCFAKSDFESVPFGEVDSTSKVKLDELHAPKSLTLVGNDAFRNVGLVVGWTGSVAESKCISFNVPFKALDAVNTDNSTRTRVKATMLNSNPIEVLKEKIDTPVENLSNPDLEMKTSKLVDIPLVKSQLDFFSIAEATEEKEPHVIFKAIVNYLQDVSDLLQAPLSNSVLRLQNTFYVLNNSLYDDGCNKISKITYQIMDTLEFGAFIMVLMNNRLRYICDCNLYTDIKLGSEQFNDDNLPIKTFLHSGDIIGEYSTISGHEGILTNPVGERDNVGKRFYDMILRNGFEIDVTKRDCYVYVPCVGQYLYLHDKRADNIEGEEKIEVECKSVLDMGDYNKLLGELKKIKKNTGGYNKFFDNIAKLSASEVNKRIKDIGTIDDEKEAQLFLVSKKFNEIVDNNGGTPNPNLLTYELFDELSRSYWMIHKDVDWLQQTGSKSLNRTAEYHIGKYKLTEFKSNQIVKFSNPYMNGCKGAYVFTLASSNTILGVYASRFSMHYITEKLYNLTRIKPGVAIPDSILSDATRLDKLDPCLFYPFYDVLYTKGGWSFKDFIKNGYSNQNVEFNISMYKPNGIFYLTMTRMSPTYDNSGKKVKVGAKTMPIVPIGNMDRALMVATTTNTNAKELDIYEELMQLAAYSDAEDRLLRVYKTDIKDELKEVFDKYVAARQLVIDGNKDVSKYKQLVDDRIVYMLGTVHKGKLQREFDTSDDIDLDDIDLDDITDETFSDAELGLDETDENDTYLVDDIDIDDDDIDIDIDETEDDESDSEGITFEEFFETAKSMGVTDESQARAMYTNFLANNQ